MPAKKSQQRSSRRKNSNERETGAVPGHLFLERRRRAAASEAVRFYSGGVPRHWRVLDRHGGEMLPFQARP